MVRSCVIVYVQLISQRQHEHPPKSYGGGPIVAAFVSISFFARKQPDISYVLVKADKLVRTAGTPSAAR